MSSNSNTFNCPSSPAGCKNEATLPAAHPHLDGPPDVFISYKRTMRHRVSRIVELLRALRLTVWFDGDLAPGESYITEIARRVREARCVLVCWSQDAFASGGDVNSFVRGEAMIAHERGVMVPVLLEPVSLDPPWNTIHTESLIGWFEHETPDAKDAQSWIEVLDAIGRKVGRLGLADYVRANLLGDRKVLKAWAEANPTDPLAEVALARAAAVTESAGADRSVSRSDAGGNSAGRERVAVRRARGGLMKVGTVAAMAVLALLWAFWPGFQTDFASFVDAASAAGMESMRNVADQLVVPDQFPSLHH
jgi:TIR domain